MVDGAKDVRKKKQSTGSPQVKEVKNERAKTEGKAL